MNIEIWKDIVGYEGLYQVSNMGNVRSADRTIKVKRGDSEYFLTTKGKVLRGQARRHGYLSVWLYKLDGSKRQESIHRLVAEAFCIRRDGDTDVNHKNEIKTDNRASNLEWCTHKENSNYGTAQQRRLETDRVRGNRCKPIRQYDLQGNLIAEYPSLKEASMQTGIASGNICKHIQGNKQYSHVGGYHWEYVKRGNKAESL